MSEPAPETRITKGDIEAVAAKLQTFAQGLSEQERNVLGLLLTRAETASEEEVAGYALRAGIPSVPGMSTPVSSQLAKSVGLGSGLGPRAGTVTVSWGYHFGSQRFFT